MKNFILFLSAIILSELGYAQHTLVLNPVADCYVETYGGGVGKNSFLKFDISSLPAGIVLTNTKLRTFVSDILPGWDGDLKIIHYTNQTWIEGDSNKFIWQPVYFTDTITQLIGFGTVPGWAETIDFNSFLNVDYLASNNFFSVLLKDVDDTTCCPDLNEISINDNDSMMLGNIFNDNIVFRPREWVIASPELVIDYGIPPTVQPVSPVSPVCENSSVSFSISATGDSPFTYQWQLNGFDITGANADTYSLASAQLTDDGNYTCIVTNAYGSDTSDVISLVVNAVPIISFTNTNVLCYGDSSGTIDLTVTNGTLPYNYSWSNGATTEDLNGLTAGIYSPTVTDANGCTATTSVTISQPDTIIVTASQTNVTCNGLCDGTVTLYITGGSDPYSYLWSNGAISNPITNLCAGIYSSTITDANGCTATTSVTISEQAILSVSVSQTNVTCNGLCNGTATPVISGGTSPYSCLWSNGQTSINATNLCAGIYSVTVTDGNNCTATTSDTITQPVVLTMSVLSQTNVHCNGFCDGSATVTIGGGTSPYSINWSNGMSFNNITSTTSTVNGLCAGAYSATLTDANGCTATTSVTITEPSAIIVSVSQTNVKCNGVCDGNISLSASGGVPSYTYLWGNAEIDSTITDLCAGVHCYTVTDANNCIATGCVTITQPAPITASVSQTNVTCNGICNGTAALTVSGENPPYSYLWNNLSTGDSIINLCSGTYCCTITDSNNCTITTCVTITQPAAIIVSVSQTNITCNGLCDGTATLTVSGEYPPYSYLWSNLSTGNSIIDLCSGEYCCTITDSNNCTITACVTITEPAALSISVLQTNITCNGLCDGTATLTASGGTSPYMYIWSNNAIGSSITNLCAGVYCCTITDSNNCTITTCVTITEPSALSISVSQTNVTCNGLCDGTATVTVSGGTPGYAYLWNTVPIQNTTTIVNLCAGIYNLTVTDSNGCTATASVIITEPNPMAVSIISLFNPTCNDLCNGTADINVSGGTTPYAVLWSDGQTGTSITGLCAGNYFATITDANICITVLMLTVTEPVEITINTITTNASCGLCDGSAISSASGGNPPYNFVWDDLIGTVNDTIANLCAGLLHVTVIDANLCTSIDTVYINNINGPILDSMIYSDVSCHGYCDGWANIYVSGGNPPYVYLWSNGDTTSGINPVCAGYYDVTITDNSACITITSVNINEPIIMTATLSSTDDYGANDGTATVFVSGGGAPYAYLWDDLYAQITSTATNLVAGWYHVTVTNANGCTIIDSVEVLLWTEVVTQKINFNYTLYPNPAESDINLKITTDKAENISLTIYNSIGNLILTKEISLTVGDNLNNFDLQRVTPGIYFVKLQQSDKVSYIKFVKN